MWIGTVFSSIRKKGLLLCELLVVFLSDTMMLHAPYTFKITIIWGKSDDIT